MDLNELTFQINGAIFEVNKVLGSGFLEKVYEKALLTELANRNIKAESQVPIKVEYKEVVVGDYSADIVVDDRIILELKAVEFLKEVHTAQLLNYMRATGYKCVTFPRNCGQSEKLLQTASGGLTWFRRENVTPVSLRSKRLIW